MKLLVLGGTIFLGRHVVEEALARNHEVTLFNRGRTNADLFEGVERLTGDRVGGDLAALQGRTWDAVIDTSGYVPRVVGDSARLLADKTGRYLFVSTCSVFSDEKIIGMTEDSRLIELEDPTTEEVMANYGGLKVLCERVVNDVYGDRALVIRPGVIAGPHDPTYRFTYWVDRMERGGPTLAAEADSDVQLIDVRDISGWMISMLEDSAGGTYNATGPAERLTLRAMLEACSPTSATDDVAWAPTEYLFANGVVPFQDLPLWVPASHRGMVAIDCARAISQGLRYRPLRDTAADTRAWWHDAGEPRVDNVGLMPERESDLLERLPQ